jgi:hypothetical protein
VAVGRRRSRERWREQAGELAADRGADDVDDAAVTTERAAGTACTG